MKLGVVGSRSFDNPGYLWGVLGGIDQLYGIDTLVSGGARGADSLGEEFAREHNIPTVVIKPQWDKYGKSAGFRRNKEIVDEADKVVAFWDGKSKGTEHTIKLARQEGKLLQIFTEWEGNG